MCLYVSLSVCLHFHQYHKGLIFVFQPTNECNCNPLCWQWFQLFQWVIVCVRMSSPGASATNSVRCPGTLSWQPAQVDTPFCPCCWHTSCSTSCWHGEQRQSLLCEHITALGRSTRGRTGSSRALTLAQSSNLAPAKSIYLAQIQGYFYYWTGLLLLFYFGVQ